MTGDLVRAQLLEDGTYPGAEAAFAGQGDGGKAETGASSMCPEWAQSPVADYSPDQPRDPEGRWTAGGGAGAGSVAVVGQRGGSARKQPDDPGIVSRILNALNPIGTAEAQEREPAEAQISTSHIEGHLHNGSSEGSQPERLVPETSSSVEGSQIVGHSPDGTPIEKTQQSCSDFIAANCKAGILREFPGEYLDEPVSKVYEDAAAGIASARKAKKLLQQDRFRK